jgi:carbamoyl-phosphate synthase small subunit
MVKHLHSAAPIIAAPFFVRPKDAPDHFNAVLALADGSVFWGQGVGAEGDALGEVCFNTSITGYQEILSDPSYAGQIVTFTFPHIGNVGTNHEDIETINPAARGLVLRAPISEPSNWRSSQSLNNWLQKHGITGISGVDTRRLTRRLRDFGSAKGVIAFRKDARTLDAVALVERAKAWSGLNGLDLVPDVTTRQSYRWQEAAWDLKSGFGQQNNPTHKVVAIDYGAKRNILRCLAQTGADVVVVPSTASFDEIISHRPDGIFLSNGPGDPAATGQYAVPVIQQLIETAMPIFGICLGHQMLALALGGRTEKMHHGHRGGNHPVKDLATGKVEITSQNHGFCVVPESLPDFVDISHVSLFDGTNEGLSVKNKPIFSVQYHPEASPGPHDSHYLFDRFTQMIQQSHKAVA